MEMKKAMSENLQAQPNFYPDSYPDSGFYLTMPYGSSITIKN